MNHIWAIADLHLSFGLSDKNMDIFGPEWENHFEKIKEAWESLIQPEDLVLLPGDISWAMRLEEALIDLEWIDALPGTKVMIRGNHDYWWSSPTKMRRVMPPSIHFIQNSVFNWEGVTVGGSRLWDCEEYTFNQYIHFRENPSARAQREPAETSKPIFQRELERLKLSLDQLDPKAKRRIALTHYPPIGADLQPSSASALLEKYQIDTCVFGHLHSLKKGIPLFGEVRGVRYLLTSADYLNFVPLQLF
jgi:predicted phosphohydrolase